MKYSILLLIGVAMAAGAIYLVRAGDAQQPQFKSGVVPQVSGRLVDPIRGSFDDGTGYQLLCEYDSWVLIRNGVVHELLAFAGGPTVPDSPTVKKGDVVEGRGVPFPPTDTEWPEDVTMASVYRGKDGDLHTGCAPESIFTKDSLDTP